MFDSVSSSDAWPVERGEVGLTFIYSHLAMIWLEESGHVEEVCPDTMNISLE